MLPGNVWPGPDILGGVGRIGMYLVSLGRASSGQVCREGVQYFEQLGDGCTSLRGILLLLSNKHLWLVVQLLSLVRLFTTPWPEACQASLSFIISWSLLKLMSIESVMPSNHLILCYCLLLPSIFPSIRVFSNELVLHIRWPKYWSFGFNNSPSNNIQD